jgi:hypothetical protein
MGTYAFALLIGRSQGQNLQNTQDYSKLHLST